jgi:hypothetical protein
MGKPRGTHYVVTASFTATGAPAYLSRQGDWVSDLQAAATFEDEQRKNGALAQAAKDEALVCDAYAFMVSFEGELIDPLSAREAIRAEGPSVFVRRPDEGLARKRG